MRNQVPTRWLALLWLAYLCCHTFPVSLLASENGSPPPLTNPLSAEPPPPHEDLEVNKIREKYWSLGDDNRVGVVQDRLYAKRGKIELSLSGGIGLGDPFLNTYVYGLTLGFHFSEMFSVHAIGWKAVTTHSSAFDAVQRDTGAVANTNPVSSYLGGEARGSFFYGKAELLGTGILYFDTYLSLGAGRIATKSGSNLALTAGIAEELYLSRWFSINVDFKLMRYRESVLHSETGRALGERTTLAWLVGVGLGIFIDPLPHDPKL